MKKIFIIVLCAMLCLSLSACGHKQKKHTETVFDRFDSFAQLTAYTENEEEWQELLGIFTTTVDKYHRLLNAYNPYEDTVNIYSINNRTAENIEVSDELFRFLCKAKELYELTDGLTSITMGAVTRIWKTAIENQALPSKDELQKAAEHINIDSMTLDYDTLTVTISDPLIMLDVGAIGKGYVADMLLDELINNGFDSFLINLGGTVLGYGEKPDGSPWTSGIQAPEGVNTEEFSVNTSGMTLSTSGSYHRGFELDGIRYHHIIDPKTLYPKNEFLSVSVLCDNAAEADALSTALFNMTLDEGKQKIADMDDINALWILQDGTTVASESFK